MTDKSESELRARVLYDTACGLLWFFDDKIRFPPVSDAQGEGAEGDGAA